MRQPGPFGIKSEFSRTDGGVSAQEIELSIGTARSGSARSSRGRFATKTTGRSNGGVRVRPVRHAGDVSRFPVAAGPRVVGTSAGAPRWRSSAVPRWPHACMPPSAHSLTPTLTSGTGPSGKPLRSSKRPTARSRVADWHWECEPAPPDPRSTRVRAVQQRTPPAPGRRADRGSPGWPSPPAARPCPGSAGDSPPSMLTLLTPPS
jgi:hypothetical protein